MKVSLQDLINAYQFVSAGQGESEALISRETGQIYWQGPYLDAEDEELPDDIDDPDKYIAVPNKGDLDLGTRLVHRFAAERLPQHAALIRDFFSRKGGYRRGSAAGLPERKRRLDRRLQPLVGGTANPCFEAGRLSDSGSHA